MYYGQFYLLLISFIAFEIPSYAKTIFVDDNASEGGDGTSWASAHKYLQDALAVAEYGDEIWVAEGTYKPDQGAGKTLGDRTASFYLVDGVGMYGGFIGSESSKPSLGDVNKTILSGEIDQNSSLWSLHIVRGNQLSSSTILDRFQITKGNANGKVDGWKPDYSSGGCLLLTNSSITIRFCLFTNGSASYGGGVSTSSRDIDSPLSFSNCSFNNNAAEFGGGISFSGPLIMDNCIFRDNYSSSSGEACLLVDEKVIKL